MCITIPAVMWVPQQTNRHLGYIHYAASSACVAPFLYLYMFKILSKTYTVADWWNIIISHPENDTVIRSKSLLSKKINSKVLSGWNLIQQTNENWKAIAFTQQTLIFQIWPIQKIKTGLNQHKGKNYDKGCKLLSFDICNSEAIRDVIEEHSDTPSMFS